MQLEPTGRTGFGEDAEATMLGRLPHADAGAGRVHHDRHGAELADLHWRDRDLAAVGRGGLDRLGCVVGGEIDRPHVGRSFRCGAHAPADQDAIPGEAEVAAEL